MRHYLISLITKGSELLSKAFGPLSKKLEPHWTPVRDIVSEWIFLAVAWTRRTYKNVPAVKATVDGLALLLGIWLLDSLLKFPAATRTLYIAPIWLAAQGSRRPGGPILVVATCMVMTSLDRSQGLIVASNFWLNLVLRMGVLTGLMLLAEFVDTRIRTYSTLATRDPLTGAANRTVYQEFGRRAVDRSIRTRELLTLAMIDCDRFKQLNDEFGHDYGDKVLRTLTKCLQRVALPDGLVARTGGDEFMVVMPRKTAEETMRILDRALDRFAAATDIDGKSAGFSYGIAEFGIDRKTLADLEKVADRDMYLRKANKAVVEGLGNIPEQLLNPASQYKAAR